MLEKLYLRFVALLIGIFAPQYVKEELKKKRSADEIIDAMKTYSEILCMVSSPKTKSALEKATKKIVELMYKYDSRWIKSCYNQYWIRVVASVLDALDVTIRFNKTDGHMKTVLKSYAQDLVDLLDDNDAECKEVLEKARELGIVATHP